MPEIRAGDVEAMARTIYGEARGESIQGKIAVGYVIWNRYRRPGWWSREKGDGIPDDTIEAVTRDPWQFSMWNAGDPNGEAARAVDLSDSAYRDCMYTALAVIQNRALDPTGGATHYFATHTDPPEWADPSRQTVEIGRHAFYELG